jgi:trigger factor
LNVEPEVFEKSVQKVYLKQRERIYLQGFRKGKAPRQVIEAMYGKEVFYEEAINELLPELYEKALDEHVLDVVSRPHFEAPTMDNKTGAVITAEFYVKPEVTITDYLGLTYKKPSLEASDAEVEAAVNEERAKNMRVVSVHDRAVIDGDAVIIDFEGFVDGETFEGGKGEDYRLVIGSGSFIDDFEDQIIGRNIDDEFDVEVTFPTPYASEDLAGRDAVFKVRLNAIEYNELPELDDDFAQEVSEFETFEEYKAEIKATIERNKAENIDAEIEGLVIMELIKKLDEINPTIPREMFENEMDSCLRDFARNLQMRGINFNQYMNYMGQTQEGMRESFRPNAINNVKGRLALEAAAKNEDIPVDEDEFNAELDRMAEEYQIEREKIETVMGKREIEMLRKDLKVKKTLKKIRESAVAVEE